MIKADARNVFLFDDTEDGGNLGGVAPVDGKTESDFQAGGLAIPNAGDGAGVGAHGERQVGRHELASRRVAEVGTQLIADCGGSELGVLLDASREALARAVDEKIVELVLANREGKIKVKPGFDGEYGVLQLTQKEKEEGVVAARKQRTLDDYENAK